MAKSVEKNRTGPAGNEHNAHNPLMKSVTWLAWIVSFAAGAFSLQAAESASIIQLRGIARFSTHRLALLEMNESPRRQLYYILEEGERDDELEVLKIDFVTSKVKVRNAGEVAELTFEAEGAASVSPGSGSTEIRAYEGRNPFFFAFSRPARILSFAFTNSWSTAP